MICAILAWQNVLPSLSILSTDKNIKVIQLRPLRCLDFVCQEALIYQFWKIIK